MKKSVIIAFTLIIIAALAAFFLSGRKSGNSKEIQTAQVEKGDITRSISATGRLNPARSVAVGSQVSGVVKKIYVDYNSVVKKGQVIVQLDPALFSAQVLQAKANLEAAEARLNQARANYKREESVVRSGESGSKATLDERKSNLERVRELFNRGMISMQELDKAREQYEIARSAYDTALTGKDQIDVRVGEMDAAMAAVSQSKAALNLAQTNLGYTTITSPMDGVVISRNVDEGQTVAASLSAPTLVTIGDLSIMEVKVSVDEADIGQVKVGQPASFTVDSYPGMSFEGTVSKIYLAPIIQQNVVTYEVIVRIENKERLLMPGMTANVNILTMEKKGILMIPNQALRVKMQDRPADKPEKGKRRVWVKTNGAVSERQIKTGVSDNRNTEVLEGLAEGETVVTEGDSASAGKGRSSSPLRVQHH